MNQENLLPDTRTAILNALAGSSSQKPVNVADLYPLGSLDDVEGMLHRLRDSGEINSAIVTRGGVTSALFWLTGVLHPTVKGQFVINKHTVEHAREKRLPIAAIASEPDKETNMTNTTPEFGRQAIYSLIVDQPGILLVDLIRATQESFPDIEHKKILKTIDNMWRMAKQIRFDGEGKNRAFYANDAKKPAAIPVKTASPPIAKQPVCRAEHGTGREVKPAKKPVSPSPVIDKPFPAVPPTCAKKQVIEDDEFDLMLSDSNCLYISMGDEVFRLNPAQLARLDHFLARILTDGVRLADGVRA